MAAAQHYHGSSIAFAFVLGVAALTMGCCGPMACGPRCGSNGPLMLGAGCSGGSCGGCDGCGERYVDEWINHPPSCDQCDSCGNHNGQTCGSCRPMFDGFASLWGYRRDCGCESGACSGGATCDGGCSGGGGGESCGGGCQSCGGGGGEEYADAEMGQHYIDSSAAIPIPRQMSPAPRIVEAKPAIKPYHPQRTKQIFRPKGSMAGNTPQLSSY